MMSSWKHVEIPVGMKSLPKDTRGYPIPFSVVQSDTGEADFRQHDLVRVTQSMMCKLCSICGQPLGSDIWLISGIKVAFEPNGGYVDPPMHKQCATYALKVCPYLAVPSFLKRNLDDIPQSERAILSVYGKPPVFALVQTSDYNIVFLNTKMIILPIRPFLATEFWRAGNQISFDQARMLL